MHLAAKICLTAALVVLGARALMADTTFDDGPHNDTAAWAWFIIMVLAIVVVWAAL